MVLGFFSKGFVISTKRLTALLLLFVPSFLWFYLFGNILNEFIAGLKLGDAWVYLGTALFFVSIICSSLVGSMLSEKWKRRQLLKFWILFGVISTALFGLSQGLISSLLLGVLAGASWGVGLPSSLAFLADSTIVEERARVSSVLILILFVSLISTIMGLSIVQLLSPERLFEYLFIILIVRATSSFALLVDLCEGIKCKEKGWMAIFNKPGFKLYFISWLMFSVSGGIFDLIELPSSLLAQEGLSTMGPVAVYVGVTFSALISGFGSDRFGRRITIIFGLITLGIGYILFGIAINPISYLLIKAIYGFAWGIILVVYSLTVIGDFASKCSKERFYAVGFVVPLIVFASFQFLSGAFSLIIPISISSQILGIMLFISMIPLLYAPETLPRDKIRRRKFGEHIQKLKKLVEEEERG